MVLVTQWEKRSLLSFLAGVSFIIIKDFSSTALENQSSFLNVIPTLEPSEEWAGFWTCCAAAALRCWCRSGRGTAGSAQVIALYFCYFCLVFISLSHHCYCRAEYNSIYALNTYQRVQVSHPADVSALDEWILSPSYSFESLQTSHSAWR